MDNCIFSGFCDLPICDLACANLVESTYLIERNRCVLTNGLAATPQAEIIKMQSVLHTEDKPLQVLVSDSTSTTANLLTYCAIGENWQGNRLHCNVYHLRFSGYLDSLQRSWGLKDIPESLEYEQIWLSTAKILIISNIDFVKFNDFPAQTLLNIIHDREVNNLRTFVISPKIPTLIGSGPFFLRVKSMLEGAVVSWQ